MDGPTHYQITASHRVAAPPARVYDIIADYRSGHPHIVPSAFRNLQVEQGGRGAGTVIRFEAHAFGRTETLRHIVEEPEPGRVLVERDTASPLVTTFTVERGATERESHVTIKTDLTSRSGVLGAIERVMTKAFLQRLYRQELEKLEAFAQKAV